MYYYNSLDTGIGYIWTIIPREHETAPCAVAARTLTETKPICTNEGLNEEHASHTLQYTIRVPVYCPHEPEGGPKLSPTYLAEGILNIRPVVS